MTHSSRAYGSVSRERGPQQCGSGATSEEAEARRSTLNRADVPDSGRRHSG